MATSLRDSRGSLVALSLSYLQLVLTFAATPYRLESSTLEQRSTASCPPSTTSSFICLPSTATTQREMSSLPPDASRESPHARRCRVSCSTPLASSPASARAGTASLPVLPSDRSTPITLETPHSLSDSPLEMDEQMGQLSLGNGEESRGHHELGGLDRQLDAGEESEGEY